MFLSLGFVFLCISFCFFQLIDSGNIIGPLKLHSADLSIIDYKDGGLVDVKIWMMVPSNYNDYAKATFYLAIQNKNGRRDVHMTIDFELNEKCIYYNSKSKYDNEIIAKTIKKFKNESVENENDDDIMNDNDDDMKSNKDEKDMKLSFNNSDDKDNESEDTESDTVIYTDSETSDSDTKPVTNDVSANDNEIKPGSGDHEDSDPDTVSGDALP